VRVVDPRRVRYFAKSAGRLAKNDPIDAEMIAWFRETFSLRPSRPTTPSAWRSTGWSPPAAGWSGGPVLAPGEEPFSILRSWPHGHVAIPLGMLRSLGLDRLLEAADHRCGGLTRPSHSGFVAPDLKSRSVLHLQHEYPATRPGH